MLISREYATLWKTASCVRKFCLQDETFTFVMKITRIQKKKKGFGETPLFYAALKKRTKILKD